MSADCDPAWLARANDQCVSPLVVSLSGGAMTCAVLQPQQPPNDTGSLIGGSGFYLQSMQMSIHAANPQCHQLARLFITCASGSGDSHISTSCSSPTSATHTPAAKCYDKGGPMRSRSALGERVQSSEDSKALNPYVTQKTAITAPTRTPEARNTAVLCHKSKFPA